MNLRNGLAAMYIFRMYGVSPLEHFGNVGMTEGNGTTQCTRKVGGLSRIVEQVYPHSLPHVGVNSANPEQSFNIPNIQYGEVGVGN